jgi:hypothetical protein
MQRGSQSRAARRFREFREKVLRAGAEARAVAEAEVYKTDKVAWLRLGPGRERPGEPGWTESQHVTMSGDPNEPMRIEVV